MLAGISIKDFWESSLSEIQLKMETHAKQQKQIVKEKIVTQFMLSSLIGEQIAASIDRNVKISRPWDRYPELFTEEKRRHEEEKAKDELEAYKAMRKAYCQRHNKKRKGGEEKRN